MGKRFLDYTPRELVKLGQRDFLDSIRASEGRVVGAYVCPYAPNYVEKVSNLELAASFGADYITLEGLNPRKMQMPGLPSKNPGDDSPFKASLQVEMGYGWSVPELKNLVGRPIGLILLVPQSEDAPFGPLYADSAYSPEMVQFVSAAGFDFVVLCGLDFDSMIRAVENTKALVGDTMVIEAGIPHGPGTIQGEYPPYNLRGVSTPEFVKRLAKAGADIVDIPAVGVAPGFTMDYVGSLVDAAHEGKALAAASIAHSVEGSDPVTVGRAAVDNKICGFDMFNFAAGGVYESVALPEQLQNFCIALKGRRHTFRRMCQSPLR
ncbi:hypothetical protein LQZ19_09660 [Treponema primitia]|uniref:DUF7916 family protein n=1 Tax=Treponema primitia TaxID=88058 RepID=UPI00397F626B